MINERIREALVTGYGYDGEGICRVDGKVCFVRCALKDELIKFRIIKETSSFDKGELVSIVKNSTKRIEARCPYFGVCGGCAYQHTSYENELEIKKGLLQSQLQKLNFTKDVEVFSSDCEYGYRNKIKLFVGNKIVGLKKVGTNEIVDIDDCLLVESLIRKAIKNIKVFLKAKNIYPMFKEIVIRQENGKCLINFIKKTQKGINYQGLFLMLGSEFGIIETYKNNKKYIMGQKILESNELGLHAKFTVDSFHQVNKYIAKQLYNKILSLVQGESVVNCYSGAGVLSGALAKICQRVVGIELGKNEHNDAEKLKDENGLFNLLNINGDCEKVLNYLDEDFDTVIIDPPRAGVSKGVIDVINNTICKKLVYVSCNSATLIRDISRLESYSIDSINLYDMFPRTGEYEVLAVLNRK